MQALVRLETADLQLLASELRSGRIVHPVSAATLSRWFSDEVSVAVAADLALLMGFSLGQIATLLDALVADRSARCAGPESVELVATSPLEGQHFTRQTSAVVQNMFAAAEHSVDVVGYAVHQGKDVFRVLAERMDARENLRVRMFLHIGRPAHGPSAPSEIVGRFVTRFRQQEWPEGVRLPELYYDPRGLETEGDKRASLHAKCVIVDGRTLLVSSANFTEAAHERNIEVGIRLTLPDSAARLVGFLDQLVEQGVLVRATVPSNLTGS